MPGSADLSDEANWSGGLYGISLDFGLPSDDRVAQAIDWLWNTLPINGCWSRETHNPLAFQTAVTSLASVEDGGLYGSVQVLDLGEVVCGVFLHHRGAGDELEVAVPVGALEKVEPRIGGFPFGEGSGSASLVWRSPIDRWFADWAIKLRRQVPFLRGAIGFEVPTPDEVDANGAYFGRLTLTADDVEYLEASQ